MSEKEDLEKQAQAYLVEAREALQKAADCAEKGGFNIRFSAGGTYVPSAAFETSPELRQEAIDELKDDPGWAEKSEEEQNEEIEDLCNDWRCEMKPYSADEPGWWQPSRIC